MAFDFDTLFNNHSRNILTNEQFKKKVLDMWANGNMTSYVKVGDILYEIEDVYLSDRGNIIVETREEK